MTKFWKIIQEMPRGIITEIANAEWVSRQNISSLIKRWIKNIRRAKKMAKTIEKIIDKKINFMDFLEEKNK